MSNSATQLERLHTAFTKDPSGETLMKLYKVANRANKRLLVTWGSKLTDRDVTWLNEPIEKVSYTRPTGFFHPGWGFPGYPPKGTLYIAFGIWWTFDEISYKLKVKISDV